MDIEIGESSHTPFASKEPYLAAEAVYSEPFPTALTSPAYYIPLSSVLKFWEQQAQVTPDVLGLIT